MPLLSLIIAAIRSGTDPVALLPPGAFHRWLEDPIYCPKCDATYLLVVDYAGSVSKFFTEESRRHLSLLRKAIVLGHGNDHRVTHFETNGVIVTSHAPPRPIPIEPLSKLIN